MAQNYIQPGHTVALTMTADTPSGTLVYVGAMAAVTTVHIPAGGYGACALSGVWELPKDTAQALTPLVKVYMDDTGKITTTDTGNEFVGYVVEDAAANAPTAMVLLNGLPGPRV